MARFELNDLCTWLEYRRKLRGSLFVEGKLQPLSYSLSLMCVLKGVFD